MKREKMLSANWSTPEESQGAYGDLVRSLRALLIAAESSDMLVEDIVSAFVVTALDVVEAAHPTKVREYVTDALDELEKLHLRTN